MSDQELLAKVTEIFKQHRPYYNYIVLDDCREALLTLDDNYYYRTVAQTDQAMAISWLFSAMKGFIMIRS